VPGVSGILLFGGSFDPIHHGHLIVARAAAEQLGVERVVLIPSARPPHTLDRQLTLARLRVRLCELAVADDPLFAVDDWETRQSGPNYTLLTVHHFRERLGPEPALYWLIGADSLAELHTWYRVPELVEACMLVTVARPGVDLSRLPQLERLLTPAQLDRLRAHVLSTPRIEISASDIRARLRAGRSIRYLVPEAVRAEIERLGLYREERRAK